MISQLIERALKVIPSIPILINVISIRTRQLSAGSNSMAEVPPNMNLGLADIALMEVIQGKLKVIYVPHKNSFEV